MRAKEDPVLRLQHAARHVRGAIVPAPLLRFAPCPSSSGTHLQFPATHLDRIAQNILDSFTCQGQFILGTSTNRTWKGRGTFFSFQFVEV